MAGKYRVYIRNLYYINNTYIDDIIKSLCKYCRKKNLTIKTILDTGKFNDKNCYITIRVPEAGSFDKNVKINLKVCDRKSCANK